MIAHGANVNATDQWNRTVLMHASEAGLPDRMALLLKHGARIDAQEEAGYTALFLAVINRQIESVKLLLKYHADPNLKAHYNMSPLEFTSDLALSPEFSRLLKAARATN